MKEEEWQKNHILSMSSNVKFQRSGVTWGTVGTPSGIGIDWNKNFNLTGTYTDTDMIHLA